MVEMQIKRPPRRISRPQQVKQGGTPPVSQARKVAAFAVILLVVLAAVIAVVKYAGKTRTTVTTSGPIVHVAGRTENAAEGPPDGSVAVITNAVIVPPDPTSRTPLSIIYETSNPGGGPLTTTFSWYVDGTLVQDGPSNTLQPGPYRKGASVYADVTLADQNAGNNTKDTPAIIIANGLPEVTAVILGPENAVTGTMLSATPAGTDPDGDIITYMYQWRVNGNSVGAPTGERTFSTSELRKKDVVSVIVTYTDGIAEGTPVSSNSIILQNINPKITSTPPLGLADGLLVYQVTAKDPDGDPLTFRLDRFPPGMAIDATSGLIRWELPKGVLFTGRNEVIVSVTVTDGDGGADSQEFNIILTDFIVSWNRDR